MGMNGRVPEQGLSVHGLSILSGKAMDFTVAPNECVSLTGPSGSGKTLLLRALADLDEHSGQVSFDGVDATAIEPPRWRRQLGLLLAESQWWRERVVDHFPALDDDARQELQALGFDEQALQWSVSRLSSGERQRLALLRLLALQPQMLLLDEPTANLDPENTRIVEQVVDDYRRRHACPVLWVSHDAGQRERVARRHLAIGPDGLEELS